MHRTAFVPLIALCLLAGCDRAAMRIPGASDGFAPASTGTVATRSFPGFVEVIVPSDMRPAHIGEKVAGTSWTACREDAMFGASMPAYVQGEVQREAISSKLFAGGASRLILKTEVDAFCAQAVGFVIQRVAGIVAIRFTLTRDGKTIWERRIEHVVTDADDAYSGSQVTTIEQAMRTTMTDSLRLVLRDLLSGLAGSDIGAQLAEAGR